ncbi:hypothetical protein MBGDF03_01013 [Thermoplasmatales archaeon SCGC AB-540-F20]|nr:hypothetical protein MBGDF03_01013 [Thermoplasmatales archaeon SCGC AB-540-F20]
MKMRVLILGIDALEYDLVEEWDLKNLKQKEYGKICVPIPEGFIEPATMIVWLCFITGQPPERMGYSQPVLYRWPFNFLFDLYFKTLCKSGDIHPEDIMKKRGKKREVLDRISDICKKMNISYDPKKKNIKAETFFDNDQIKSTHFHIPAYDDAFPKYRNKIVDVLTKKISEKEFSQECKQVYKYRCEELDEYLQTNNDWNLIMMYWFCLDGVQHALFRKKLKIMDYYLMFNEYVGRLSKELSKDTLILIVSDHGQKKGIHTNHGFYSSNKKLGLKNPDITDFKEIIEKTID